MSIRKSIIMDYSDMTDEELLEVYDEIMEQYEDTGVVESLSDFEEIVRELTLREE
jgi:hypothetical protein